MSDDVPVPSQRLPLATSPLAGPFSIAGYEAESVLGEGGMGIVYVAHAKDAPASKLALKVLIPDRSDDASFVNMFLDEMRLARCLSHPNIVGLRDAGNERGRPYMVMELLDGVSLRAMRLASASFFGGTFPEVAWIGAQAAYGLDAAHKATDETGAPLQLIHRDVTPSNVMLVRGGGVKLIDFGLAKATGRRTKSRFGVLKGSVPYLAPELLRGEEPSVRSDVFSLGTTLWELAVGKRLFARKTSAETLEAIHRCVVPSARDLIPELPEDLDAALAMALERDPERRYQSAAELALALESCTLPVTEGSAKLLIDEVIDEVRRKRVPW